MKVYELINYLMEVEAGADVSVCCSDTVDYEHRGVDGFLFNEEDGVQLFAKLN